MSTAMIVVSSERAWWVLLAIEINSCQKLEKSNQILQVRNITIAAIDCPHYSQSPAEFEKVSNYQTNSFHQWIISSSLSLH